MLLLLLAVADEGVLFVASALGSISTLGLSVHLRRPELRRGSP